MRNACVWSRSPQASATPRLARSPPRPLARARALRREVTAFAVDGLRTVNVLRSRTEWAVRATLSKRWRPRA